jgi:hypothetical protein
MRYGILSSVAGAGVAGYRWMSGGWWVEGNMIGWDRGFGVTDDREKKEEVLRNADLRDVILRTGGSKCLAGRKSKVGEAREGQGGGMG